MSAAERQLNLADYANEIEAGKREVERKNWRRRSSRGFIVFATDPERVGEDDYKLVFACEARTRAEAEARVRQLVDDRRRIVAYLASGKYKDQLSGARWIPSRSRDR